MTTYVKVDSLSNERNAEKVTSISLRNVLMIAFLLATVLLSAFSLVYVRDTQHELISDIQGLNMVHDSMLSQRSQLLLEQAALRTQTRIQTLASEKLGMVFPEKETLLMADS